MKLMRPEEFAIQLNKNRNLLRVQAFDYKKLHGKYPTWFVHSKIRGQTMIDTDIYLKRLDLPAKATLYASNKLYWALRATNHSDSDMARLMASKSKHFNSVGAWIMFLSRGLFVNTAFYQLILEPTMLTEFVKIGTKHLYLLRKWDRLDLSKEKEYYEEL